MSLPLLITLKIAALFWESLKLISFKKSSTEIKLLRNSSRKTFDPLSNNTKDTFDDGLYSKVLPLIKKIYYFFTTSNWSTCQIESN